MNKLHSDQGGTSVVMLGTGTPVTDPARQGPATAVVVGDRSYLFDAGPGIVRRAAEGASRGIPALDPSQLKRLFVTHLHSDHTVGIPDLILTPWVMGRDEPLIVGGPEGTRRLCELVHEAYRDDIQVRVLGLEPTNDRGHRVEARDIGPGPAFEDERVRIEAFAVVHGVWPQAFGYRITTDDRVVVISGDTAPCADLVEAATGCDVLVHEVYSAERLAGRTPDWQKYHTAYHTSTTQLASIAGKAQPRLLVLYHQLFWGTAPDDLVAEVRQGWDGDVVSAADLDVF